MKLFKKAITLLMVTTLAMTAFAGCGKQKEIDDSQIVMTVGDKKVELGMANFYARYNQPYYESMFTQYAAYGMLADWDVEYEKGVTYEDDYKDSILEQLKELYVLQAHAEEYKVSLTEDDLADIEKAAADFKAANKAEVYKQVSGKYAAEFFQLIANADKMQDAVKASHTPEIKEGEADQKIMYYVEYATTTTDSSTGATNTLSDSEVKKLKEDAKTLLEGAKANGNLEAYAKENSKTAKKQAFSASNETLDKELVKAADKLELNGFTDIIVGENAIYVAQVTSLFDQEATDAKKDELIEQRKAEFYTETVEKWMKDTKSTIDKKVWAQVSMEGLKVNTITPEEKTEE